MTEGKVRGIATLRKKFGRHFVVTMTGLAAAATGAPASAQTPPQDLPSVISPLRVESDHNNVNLVSGKTTIEPPSLSVPGAPHLRFDRVQNAAPYVVGRVSGQAGEAPIGNWTVHTGQGASESFECSDWADCGSVTQTGSTFRGPASSNGANSVYRRAGTGAVFSYNLPSVTVGQVRQAYLSTIRYPGGEVISYTYNSTTGGPFGQILYRPIRIESSMGYHVTIAYRSNDVYEIGWGSPSEAAIYSNAAPSAALGRLTYNADGTITDLGGRNHACTGCSNALGVNIETTDGTMRLPGETALALQVARIAPNTALVGSVARDGVQWNYSYSYNNGAPYYHTPSHAYWYTRLIATGPNGFSQVYNFAISGQRNVMTGMTDSIGRTTGFQFDSGYRPIRVTYPEGNAVSVVYSDTGNIISRTAHAKPGSGFADITETALYPDAPNHMPNTCPVMCWRATWRRDGLGRQTDYLYNDKGQLTEQTEPADAGGVRRRTIVEYALSPAGISRPTAVRICGVPSAGSGQSGTCGTSAEIRTEYQYWGNTQLPSLERRIDPAGGAPIETAYAYDPAGRLLSVDGPLAGTADATYNRYDLLGRRTWEIGAADQNGVRIATRTVYRDADDMVLYTEMGTLPDAASTSLNVLRRTDIAYDAHRSPNRETLSSPTGPGQSLVTHTLLQRSFDDRGQLLCEARRMNPALYASPPADPCLPGAQGTGAAAFGPDRISRNVYDAAGQRLQARVGVGSSDEAAEATWAYNLNGQVTTVIDGNGNRAELRYDGHMRQDRWTFPSATRPSAYNDATQASALASAGAVNPADYEAYGYDAVGNRISLRKRDGSMLTYQYDNLNRMTLKVVPERAGLDPYHSRDVHYGYDLRGLQLYARFDSASGEGITNVYDGFGRLASSSTDMGGTARTLTYGYDAEGNRTRLTHPDGALFNIWYDGLNRPYYLFHSGWSGIAFVSYNAAGLPGAMGHAATTSYGYDAVQRPASLAHEFTGGAGLVVWNYGRNPAGQLRSVARDNDAFAWTGHYGANRPYTTNGRNQYTATGSGQAGTTFLYDANGNLTSETTGGVTKTYGYDIENRLISASNGAALRYDPLGRLFEVSLGGNTTRFLYDGDALVAEYDSTGAMTRRYAHWVGADVPLVSYEGASLENATGRWLFADHQGSIIAGAHPSGATAWVNTYDEYGIPGSGNQGRFQYTGQIWLAELGMYHYKARIYSPTLGRFLQTDPIGYQGGLNLYAYVGNDPVNLTDPSGLCRTGSRLTNDAIQCRVLDGYRDVLSKRSSVGRTASSAAAANMSAGILDLLMGDHDYAIPPVIICPAAWRCTQEQVASVYSSISGGIPGNSSSGMIVSGRTYTVYQSWIPVGTVTSHVGRDRLTVNNVTNRDHILYYGWVNRNAFRDAQGNWVSVTHGRGTNYYGGVFMAIPNQSDGPITFLLMDMSIRARLQGMTNGR